jgi:ketosteroid isomerase-like protein
MLAPVLDNPRTMPEESTTPDLEKLAQRWFDAANCRDVEAVASLTAHDVVWDRSRLGLEIAQGRDAVLQLLTTMWQPFDELRLEEEEVTEFGNGVGLIVLHQRGRPAGSIGFVELRRAYVVIWANGLVERNTVYADIDEARAAARRLATERG